jgi:hypothetical protein
MAHDQIGPPDKSAAAEESFGDGSGGGKTLTNAYVEGVAVNVKRRSNATINVTYVKGSETTARLRIMGCKGDPATATFFRSGELGAATAGVRALNKGEITLTPADFDASDSVSFSVNVPTQDYIRVDAKYVGGSAPGTIYAEVAGGWGM